MDYEKKYKEALATAKDCLKDGTITSTAIDYISTIFPELAESEDERIRKEMITAFSRLDEDSTLCGVAYNYKKWIAWLEKQGNNTPTIIWHNIDEKPEEMKELFCEWESDDATWHDVAFYDEESHTFRHAKMPINVTKWVYVDELLEKQGEQKPVIDFKASNWYVSKVDGKIHDMTYNPTDKVVIKKGEKSAEWSEEDEEMTEDLIKGCISAEKAHHFVHTSKEIADWLKRIKDRIGG